MSPTVEPKTKKGVGKIASDIFSGFLGALVLTLIVFQVMMMRSQTNLEFGVPSLFGYSFMRVATNSMEGDLPDSLKTGTGVVMKQVPESEVVPGDVITFKSLALTQANNGTTIIVSHRVLEIVLSPKEKGGKGGFALAKTEQYSLDGGINWIDSNGQFLALGSGTTIKIRKTASKEDSVLAYTIPEYDSAAPGVYTFWACGDNLKADTCKMTATGSCSEQYRDSVAQSEYIGKIIGHSDFFGGFLNIVLSVWFVPVACLLPLLIIVTFSAKDLIKESREEEREENRQVLLEANKAGIDINDEKSFYLFSQKQHYKIQVRKELEKTKAEEKKRILREMKKKGNGAATMEVKS